MCEVIEIGAYSGVVECLGQFNSWTGECAVTTDLVQCVPVGGVVTTVARLIQRLHLFTLCTHIALQLEAGHSVECITHAGNSIAVVVKMREPGGLSPLLRFEPLPAVTEKVHFYA